MDLTAAVDAAAQRIVDGPDIPGNSRAGTWDAMSLGAKNWHRQAVLSTVWAAAPAIRDAVLEEAATHVEGGHVIEGDGDAIRALIGSPVVLT